VRLTVAVLLALAGLAGYHELRGQADHTEAFVECLRQSGGTLITRPAQLRGYPSRDVQDGDGAAFATLAYESIDVALPGHRQELVLVERPGDLGGSPGSAAELLRQARRGDARGRALVLMRPTKEQHLDEDIERCESRADPHQDYF
jgi:hypothetical protein